MNFSPFYYHVQDLIVQDNDKALKKIFEDIEQQEEFKSYYEDFMHCTYPNSFKCLHYLMNEVHLRYDIHSIFTHAMKDNNTEWLDFFFETFQQDMAKSSQDKNHYGQILAKNIFTMSMNFDYETLLTASPEMWDIIFKSHNCNIFKPHLLLNEIFSDKKNYSKVYLLERLCHKYHIELPIKDIFSKAFYAHDMEMAQYFITQYPSNFQQDDLTDLINSVGLAGNPEVFKFFTQHFLPFENFNVEQISLVFNSGLLIGNTQLTDYLKDHHSIDFYPSDPILKKYFIQARCSIWEDNNENCTSTLELLTNVHDLFDKFSWDKALFQKEIHCFNEISHLFLSLQLHNKLQSHLKQKNQTTIKTKI